MSRMKSDGAAGGFEKGSFGVLILKLKIAKGRSFE
jgi:hypothetical protein